MLQTKYLSDCRFLKTLSESVPCCPHLNDYSIMPLWCRTLNLIVSIMLYWRMSHVFSNFHAEFV